MYETVNATLLERWTIRAFEISVVTVHGIPMIK